MRPLLAALFLLAVLVLAAGCQGLAQAMGVQPSADAPAIYNVGVWAGPGAKVDGTARNSRADQSGNVGASGEASQGQDATQTVQVDPEAVAKGLVEVAKIVTPGGQAEGLVDAGLSELAGGDAESADRLLKRARAAAKVEADAKAKRDEGSGGGDTGDAGEHTGDEGL